MSLTKTLSGREIFKFFPAREGLVSDILAGDGKIDNLLYSVVGRLIFGFVLSVFRRTLLSGTFKMCSKNELLDGFFLATESLFEFGFEFSEPFKFENNFKKLTPCHRRYEEFSLRALKETRSIDYLS